MPLLSYVLETWCRDHMNKVSSGPYPTYENIWRSTSEHLLLKLRIMIHDAGGDIVLLSCSASYGALEEHWKGANFGRIKSIVELNGIYNWLEERAH